MCFGFQRLVSGMHDWICANLTSWEHIEKVFSPGNVEKSHCLQKLGIHRNIANKFTSDEFFLSTIQVSPHGIENSGFGQNLGSLSDTPLCFVSESGDPVRSGCRIQDLLLDLFSKKMEGAIICVIWFLLRYKVSLNLG